jgi:hypothetical protein
MSVSRYAGAIIGIHKGKRARRYVIVNFAAPVYMEKRLGHRIPPEFNFLKCVPRTPGATQSTRPVDILHDTHEITPGQFLVLSQQFKLIDVTECASANDVAAITYDRVRPPPPRAAAAAR